MNIPADANRRNLLRLTRRVTVPVLLILYLFTIAAGTIFLSYAERVQRDKQYDRMADDLGAKQKNVAVYLNELVRTATNLRIDPAIELFFKYPNLPQEQMLQIKSMISSTLNAIPLFDTIYLIGDGNDAFLYFGKYLSYLVNKNGFYDREIFQLLKKDRESASEVVCRQVEYPALGQTYRYITYISHNGQMGKDGPLTAVVINMKISVIQDLIDADPENDASIMLIDRNGAVVSEGGLFPQYSNVADAGLDVAKLEHASGFFGFVRNGTSYYAVGTPLDIYGTRLIHIVPQRLIRQESGASRLGIGLGVLAALIAVTAIWSIFIRVTQRPITELIKRADLFGSYFEKGEEYVKFQSLRSAMLHGRIFSEEKRREMLRASGLPFGEDEPIILLEVLIHDFLAILRDKSRRDYEAASLSVRRKIEEIMEVDTRCVVAEILSNGSFYVIASPSNGAWAKLPDIVSHAVEELCAEIPKSLGVPINVLYNMESVPLYNVYQLVEKTQMVAANRPFFESDTSINVQSYQSADISEIYRNVFKRINKYLSAMKAEDFDHADILLDEVFDVSDVQELRFTWSAMTQNAFPVMCTDYPYEVTGKLLDILNKNPMPNRFTNVAEMKAWVRECHKLLCGNIISYKAGKNYDLVSRVNDVVRANCEKPELNVAYVAHAIGVTPNYLSSVYKKQASVKLTDYILETRLAKARDLLIGTDKLVSEIAHDCGYAYNASYFQILFKKMHGLTPSQYREKQKGG